MAAEWDLFGGALGIPVKVLDRIQDSNGLGRYMTGMLKVWLGTGKATWEQLKEALIREGNWRLAEKIEKYRKEDLKEQQKRKEQNLKGQSALVGHVYIVLTVKSFQNRLKDSKEAETDLSEPR